MRCTLSRERSSRTWSWQSMRYLEGQRSWISYSLCYLVVRIKAKSVSCRSIFRISISVEESKNAGHVVSSNALSSDFLCTNFIKYLFNYLGSVVLFFFGRKFIQVCIHFIAEVIIGKAVPNTVARQSNELVAFLAVTNDKVWIGSHSLFIPHQLWFILELEVAERSANSEVPINSLIFDSVPRVDDAFLLTSVDWLVIIGKGVHSWSCLQDRAWVTCIGTDVIGFIDKHHCSRAALLLGVFTFSDHFINIFESISERSFEVLILKFLISF